MTEDDCELQIAMWKDSDDLNKHRLTTRKLCVSSVCGSEPIYSHFMGFIGTGLLSTIRL